MELNTIQNKSNWGKATESINTNFAHVGSEIDKLKYAAYNSKLYPSLEVLQQEKPNPSVGDWAIVGDTIPGAIYRCSTEGVWSATGETGGGYGMNVTETNVTENNHYGDIINNPDDEDLKEETNENGKKVLKLADKEYNAAGFSGLGRVYLRKSESDSKNVLMQEMINRAKTRYIIQYDYDLNGAEITLPEGCVLQFEGGSFTNGTIKGNYTKIYAPLYQIFYNIKLTGTYNINSYKAVWSLGSDGEITANDIYNLPDCEVDFCNMKYICDSEITTTDINHIWRNLVLECPNISFKASSIISDKRCSSTGASSSDLANIITLVESISENYNGKIISIKTSTKVAFDWRPDDSGVPTLYKGLVSEIINNSGTTIKTKDFIERFNESATYNGNTVYSTFSVHNYIKIKFENCTFILTKHSGSIAGTITISYGKNIEIDNCVIKSKDKIGSPSLLSINSCVGGIVNNTIINDAYYTNTTTSYGLQTNSSTRIIINDCHFDNNRRGVDFSGSIESRYNVVQNSIFTGNFATGSACGGHSTSFKNIYKNNIINGNYPLAIQCRGELEQVVGNHFNGWYYDVISCGYKTIVSGNECRTNHYSTRTSRIVRVENVDKTDNIVIISENKFETKETFVYNLGENNILMIYGNTVVYKPNTVYNPESPTYLYAVKGKLNKGCFINNQLRNDTDFPLKLSTNTKLYFNYGLDWVFNMVFKTYSGGSFSDLSETNQAKFASFKCRLKVTNNGFSTVNDYKCFLEFELTEDLTENVALLPEGYEEGTSITTVITNALTKKVSPTVKYCSTVSYSEFNPVISVSNNGIYIGMKDSYNTMLKAGIYSIVFNF